MRLTIWNHWSPCMETPKVRVGSHMAIRASEAFDIWFVSHSCFQLMFWLANWSLTRTFFSWLYPVLCELSSKFGTVECQSTLPIPLTDGVPYMKVQMAATKNCSDHENSESHNQNVLVTCFSGWAISTSFEMCSNLVYLHNKLKIVNITNDTHGTQVSWFDSRIPGECSC